MSSPISIDDLPLLRLTLSPQEIVTLCAKHLHTPQTLWLHHASIWWVSEQDLDTRLPAVVQAAKRNSGCARVHIGYPYALEKLCLPFFCVQHGLPEVPRSSYEELLRTTTARACTDVHRQLQSLAAEMRHTMTHAPHVEFSDVDWTSLGRRAVEAISQDLNGKLTPAACRNGALAVLDTWLCL